jgi:hypothetical protein
MTDQPLWEQAQEAISRLIAFAFRMFWAGVFALAAVMVWSHVREHPGAMSRPLSQVSLDELVGDGCRNLLCTVLIFLLAWAALALFCRGLKKLFCGPWEEEAE